MRNVFVFTFILAGAASANASLINIAIHNGGVTVAGFNTEGDGALVSAGSNGSDTWNNIQNNGGVGLVFSGVSLSLADGTSSGATAAGTAGFSSFNNNGWGGSGDDYVMMEGWYGFRTTESMTISGLPAVFTGSGYTVTIYGDSDTTSRTMNYTIGGTTKTINDTGTFGGTFAEGDNYVTFTGLSGSSFTITGNDAATPGRSAINGIIIAAIPEPTSLALMGIVGGGCLLARRRLLT